MNTHAGKGMLAFVLLAGFALTGCVAPAPQHYGYYGQGYGQGGPCQSCGVVQNVQQVYVQRQGDGTLGAVLGAVAGGLLGHTVGKGDGRTAATVIGAVAGGAVGNAVGRNSGGGTATAWQVTVRMDDGRYVTVTQDAYPGVRPGEYVQVSGNRVYPQ